jgi:hypothetical protein
MISFIGENSSEYMTTGVTKKGQTKEEVTAGKSDGGKNSSEYMTTGVTQKGRTKEEVTAGKSDGGKKGGPNSSKYMTTGVTQKGRTKEEVTAGKSRGGRNGGSNTRGVAKTNADGSKNKWMKLELISPPYGEPFMTRASQNKANLIAALHHHNAFGTLKDRMRRNKFNDYHDEAQEAESKSCEFDCKQGGKWKLSLLMDRPNSVSTEFTPEELKATSEDLKKDVNRIALSRKRKK